MPGAELFFDCDAVMNGEECTVTHSMGLEGWMGSLYGFLLRKKIEHGLHATVESVLKASST